MGKAAKFKKLRKLANKLPALNTRRVVGVKISGKEAIERNMSHENGKPLDETAPYRAKKLVEVPLNYNRKLKDAYQKAGMKGAEMYANSVVNFVNSKLKSK